jgi:hypothetical protein
MSISISSTLKCICGHRFLGRRSIEYCTGASSTAWVEVLPMSFSGTLWWQLSASSLCPTLYSTGCTKCPTRWASTLENVAMYVGIVGPIQTTFAIMITHVSFTPIRLNAFSWSCNTLRSGNICRMLQQRNWLMLRIVSTRRWKQVTGGAMNRYVNSISL